MIEQALQGVSRRHIADRLKLSPNSITTYWARIYDKLHVSCRAELISWYQTKIDQPADPRSEEPTLLSVEE